ncbi:MAG: hypothetical protein CFE46_13285 [Burkholderiales bacterium PBB6]|nr:MAG: hypothetical protein CFE46_13285 [Burkholderiales bacterium PBB6]
MMSEQANVKRGRPGIPRDEVYAAINALVAKGASPTGLKIHNELGGRGSADYLERHLQDWRREQFEQPLAVTVGPVFAKALAQHTQELQVEAQQRCRVAFEASEAQIQELQRQKLQLEQELASQRSAVNTAEQKCAQIHGRCALLDEQLKAVVVALTGAQTQITVFGVELSTVRQERDRQVDRQMTLETELTSATELSQHLRAQLDESLRREENLKGQLDGLMAGGALFEASVIGKDNTMSAP